MNCKILILFFSISFCSTTLSSEVKDFNEVRFFREAEDKSDKVEALSFILKELLFNPSKYWGKGYLFEGDDSDTPNAQIKSISGKDYFEIEYGYSNHQFNEKFKSTYISNSNRNLAIVDSVNQIVPASGANSHALGLTINNSLSPSWDNGIAIVGNYYSHESEASFTNNGTKYLLKDQYSDTTFNAIPYLRYLREFNGKKEYRTTAYFAILLPISYFKARKKETYSNFDTGRSRDINFDYSDFEISLNLRLGIEFWLDSICIKPFTKFDTDFELTYGIGIYKILGLYDSVFFIYEPYDFDVGHVDSFSIGFNIAR